MECPTCIPQRFEPHPRVPGVLRCANCKEHLALDSATFILFDGVRCVGASREMIVAFLQRNGINATDVSMRHMVWVDPEGIHYTHIHKAGEPFELKTVEVTSPWDA